MKVSELIVKLEALKESEGDVEVIIDHHCVDDVFEIPQRYGQVQSIVDIGYGIGSGVHHIILYSIPDNE